MMLRDGLRMASRPWRGAAAAPQQGGLAVVRDLAAAFWRELLVIAVLSAVVVPSQAAVVILVMEAVGAPTPLPEAARRALAGLRNGGGFAFPFLVLLLGSLSAGIVFLVRRIAVGLMVRYERLCAERLLRRLWHEPAALDLLGDGKVITLLSKDCRFGGRIAFEVTNAVLPIGVALVALPMLFYLHIGATSTLIGVILLVALGQLLLRPMAQRISYGMETEAAPDKKIKAATLAAIRKRKEVDFNSFIDNVPHNAFMKIYRQRLTMPHLGNMIGGIALALALSIAVFWFPATTDGEAPLATLVLFLVIALFMLSQLQSLSKIVVNFYIFNAYFQRAFGIISGQPIRPEPTSAVAGDLESSQLLDES